MASLVSHVRTTIHVSREENLTLLAASLAYYAFVSVVPLLLLVLAIGSLVGGTAFTSAVTGAVTVYLSAAGTRVVEAVVTSTTDSVGVGLLGFAVLVWGGLKVFRGMKVAFVEIYDSDPAVSLLTQVRDGLAVAATICLSVATMFVAAYLWQTAPLAVFDRAVSVLDVGVLFVGLVVVFLPLYYVLPPVDVSVRDVLPGTITAAACWLLLQALFQVYAGHAEKYAVLGLLGAVILFITWLYFASIVLLVGAAVNATLKGRTA